MSGAVTGVPEHGSAGAPPFFRPCWVEVDTAALRHNLKTLRSRLSPQTALLAVVKADGYGHGLAAVCRAAVDSGAAYLGVSSLEEGMAVRKAGFRTPVLILGSLYPFDDFSVLFDYKLTPTVASLESADALDRLAASKGQRLPVHLKIDSGFGRIGVSLANGLEFIRQTARRPALSIEGLYTHFAGSDVDPDYTREQSQGFLALVDQARSAGIEAAYVHLANSAALLRFPETHATMVRPGLAIYGIEPYAGASGDDLHPALTWKSRIIFLKTIPAGASVSYGRTWKAARPSRVATLAVGYADGYPRILSNNAAVLVGGRRVPVIGRVTMDMTMIDVSELPECRVGDEAVLLGAQGGERVDAAELARAAQTNAYEILCRIGPRVPRRYTGGH